MQFSLSKIDELTSIKNLGTVNKKSQWRRPCVGWAKFYGPVVCELAVEKSAQFGDKQSWQINQAMAKRVKKAHRVAAIIVRLG